MMIILRFVICLLICLNIYQGYSDASDFFRNAGPKLIKNDKLWPHAALYYRFMPKYPEEGRLKLMEAMRIIADKTCIRFIEVKDQNSIRPLLNIVYQAACASTLGYQSDKKMTLYLHPSTCSVGSMQHELMHVLGFWHEHTRPDRDERVIINDEQIIRKNLFKNFRIVQSWNELKTGLPYDYNSIMHYRAAAFAKPGKLTIQPLFQGADTLMGQRQKLTFLDIAKINRMYKCTDYYLGDDIVPLEEQQ